MRGNKYDEARAIAEFHDNRNEAEPDVLLLSRALLSALADLDARENLLAYVGGRLAADVADDDCVPTQAEIDAAMERWIASAHYDAARRELESRTWECNAWRDLALDLRANIDEASYRDAVERQIAALEAHRG